MQPGNGRWSNGLRTSDGETWTSQPLPVNNVGLWKVSFVGAHR